MRSATSTGKTASLQFVAFKTKPELRLQLGDTVLVKNLLRDFITYNVISNIITSLYYYLKCEQAFKNCVAIVCLYGGCRYQVTCQI